MNQTLSLHERATGGHPGRPVPNAEPPAWQDTQRNRPRPAPFGRVLAVLTGLTLAAILAALLLAPYPPVQDFIEWLYQSELLVHGGWPEGVRLATWPVPNTLFQLLLTGFTLVLPAWTAAVAFLVAYGVAAVALSLTLARRYQPRLVGPVTVVLLISFGFNAPFWNGYGNYQTALLLFGGWFLLPAEWRHRPLVIMAAALLLFFTHAMLFAAFAAMVGIQALAERRVFRTGLALVPAMALFAWYVLGKDPPEVDAGPGQVEQTSLLALKGYTLAKLGPYHNFVFESGGDAVLRPVLYWAGSAVNLAYALGLLAALGWGLWTAWQRRRMPWAVLATAAVLTLLFLVMPSRIQTVVVNPGERLLYPALLLLLLSLPLPRWPMRAMAFSIPVLALSLTGLLPGAANWVESISPAGPAIASNGRQVLFWHRPSAFSCKWQEMERLQATGGAMQRPITFRTSLLVGEGGKECDPDWEHRRGAEAVSSTPRP